jgi:protein kinase A
MNGMEVAVKFPKMKVSLNPRDLNNFEREAAIQAKVRNEFPRELHVSPTKNGIPLILLQVRHPHGVHIIAASLTASDPFIVMEWVPGGTWFDKLGSYPPPPEHERIRAVREMASFLEYLHDPLIGIVHGDIKSLNILLTRDGSSKVIGAFVCPLHT